MRDLAIRGIDSHVPRGQTSVPGIAMAEGFESDTRIAAIGGNRTVIPFALQLRGALMAASVAQQREKARGKCFFRLWLHLLVIDVKSNESVAIPLLLERLELACALVTIDAMGTQIDIADTIVRRGGDYLLALKANRPALHKDVVDFFADPPADMVSPVHETVDGDHGRIETPDGCTPSGKRADRVEIEMGKNGFSIEKNVGPLCGFVAMTGGLS